jgi:hypothetical protein
MRRQRQGAGQMQSERRTLRQQRTQADEHPASARKKVFDENSWGIAWSIRNTARTLADFGKLATARSRDPDANQIEKDDPHPQVDVALGLLTTNRAPCSPSV